jgi:hypothetical protein
MINANVPLYIRMVAFIISEAYKSVVYTGYSIYVM